MILPIGIAATTARAIEELLARHRIGKTRAACTATIVTVERSGNAFASRASAAACRRLAIGVACCLIVIARSAFIAVGNPNAVNLIRNGMASRKRKCTAAAGTAIGARGDGCVVVNIATTRAAARNGNQHSLVVLSVAILAGEIGELSVFAALQEV